MNLLLKTVEVPLESRNTDETTMTIGDLSDLFNMAPLVVDDDETIEDEEDEIESMNHTEQNPPTSSRSIQRTCPSFSGSSLPYSTASSNHTKPNLSVAPSCPSTSSSSFSTAPSCNSDNPHPSNSDVSFPFTRPSIVSSNHAAQILPNLDNSGPSANSLNVIEPNQSTLDHNNSGRSFPRSNSLDISSSVTCFEFNSTRSNADISTFNHTFSNPRCSIPSSPPCSSNLHPLSSSSNPFSIQSTSITKNEVDFAFPHSYPSNTSDLLPSLMQPPQSSIQ